MNYILINIFFILILKKEENNNRYEGKIVNNTNNEMIDNLISKLIQVDIDKRIKWEEYFNDMFFKNIKGNEYDKNGELDFEGEYLNGERWNGKGKEYFDNGELKFEGEYLNGEKNEKCILL